MQKNVVFTEIPSDIDKGRYSGGEVEEFLAVQHGRGKGLVESGMSVQITRIGRWLSADRIIRVLLLF